MKRQLVFFLITICNISYSSAQEMIPLWSDGKMPNSRGIVLKDSIVNNRLYQVGSPRLYAYLADEGNNTGAAILVVPGGGYLRLTADYSKVDIATYYQQKGINAFVVYHRLPASPDLEKPEIAPWQDIQRAMKIIYRNAEKWGVDYKRIGIFGGSAGGHGASTLCTHDKDVSNVGDELDNCPYMPAFMILLSPVISFNPAIVHKGSRDRLLRSNASSENVEFFSNENYVTEYTPPAFLVHANDDKTVSSLNSVYFYQALRNAGVTSSLHIFPYGGHRLGVQHVAGSAAAWPDMSVNWLKEMKFIK
ncbi:MAG: alpha/beta hydrolase [Mangrovibacterium sp.]